MTRRGLTDTQLAVGLRAHLGAADGDLERRIRAAIVSTPQERRRPFLGRLTDADPLGRRRATLLIALLALALATSAVGAAVLLRDDRAPDLSVVPPSEPTIQPTLAPASEPTLRPTLAPHVRGWPGTARNLPGDYSWGGRCAAASCTFGFMHNGYGSGDAEIRILANPVTPTTEDWAPTTVAGLSGWYRQPDTGVEEWLVHIDDTAITIRLIVRPGTSERDLAEAHAIVESMRPATSDDGRDVRLVFTLATDDWDSG